MKILINLVPYLGVALNIFTAVTMMYVTYDKKKTSKKQLIISTLLNLIIICLHIITVNSIGERMGIQIMCILCLAAMLPTVILTLIINSWIREVESFS